MPNCQQIKEKFADIKADADNIAGLLEQYKQNGSEEGKQTLYEALEGITFEEFENDLRQSIEDLLSNHSQVDEFQEKLTIIEGSVVIDGNLRMSLPSDEEIVFPYIISKIRGTLKAVKGKFRRREDGQKLPQGLTVENDMILKHTNIGPSPPEKLRIEGDLNVMGCEYLHKLPDDLYVEGNLYIEDNHPTRGLPLYLQAKKLQKRGQIGGTIRVFDNGNMKRKF